MMKTLGLVALVVLVLFCQPAPTSGADQKYQISSEQALWVGKRIWQNECEGTIAGLTSWNAGEGFPSLGIGHFIWYVKGAEDRFEESFPGLIDYCRERGAAVPRWLSQSRSCPWPSKRLFEAARNTTRMTELRDFLAATVAIQAEYIALRLAKALPSMTATIPAAERETVAARFDALFQTPSGLYALMDYVNFKGEGINPKERYEGQGWGLLQVLQGMSGRPEGAEAVREFAESARRALRNRVANAPSARHAVEAKFLRGWEKRIDGYLQP